MTSRRDFMKKAGMIAAAAAIPGIMQATTSTEESNSLSSKKGMIKTGDQWDVIVVGGGPSGCAAATAAAREGAKVLLIESTGMLGGMGTSGLLNAWCPFTDKEKIIYKGIAEKVFLEAKKGVPHTKGNDWVPINTEYLKTVYDDLVCVILLHHGRGRDETGRSGGCNCCSQQSRTHRLQSQTVYRLHRRW